MDGDAVVRSCVAGLGADTARRRTGGVCGRGGTHDVSVTCAAQHKVRWRMGYARHIHWRAERILGALALGARFRFAEPGVGYCDRDSGLREVHVTVTRLLPIFALTVTSLVCSCLCLCFCSANVLSDPPPLRVGRRLVPFQLRPLYHCGSFHLLVFRALGYRHGPLAYPGCGLRH